MRKLFYLAAAFSLILGACRGKGGNGKDYPENFGTIGDAGRVAYMMERVRPDSLAHWMVRAALGQEPGARIDTFAIATIYAYDHLTGAPLDTFSMAYDDYVASLPLPDRMRVYSMAASEDPQQMGLRLGLEYMQCIRDNNMTADQVAKEIESLRKACSKDTVTFNRFVLGFKTVLREDRGKDLPEEIYRRFINL